LHGHATADEGENGRQQTQLLQVCIFVASAVVSTHCDRFVSLFVQVQRQILHAGRIPAHISSSSLLISITALTPFRIGATVHGGLSSLMTALLHGNLRSICWCSDFCLDPMTHVLVSDDPFGVQELLCRKGVSVFDPIS
jgi:hypothetical protein